VTLVVQKWHCSDLKPVCDRWQQDSRENTGRETADIRLCDRSLILLICFLVHQVKSKISLLLPDAHLNIEVLAQVGHISLLTHTGTASVLWHWRPYVRVQSVGQIAWSGSSVCVIIGIPFMCDTKLPLFHSFFVEVKQILVNQYLSQP